MSNTSTRGGSATNTKTTTTGEMTFVHTFVKNSFDEVWTYIQPFQGKLRAHVRIFTTGDDDNMRPTKKGISVSLDDVPKLAEAVAALLEAAKEQES
jgi:Transcriptional Coactivator p15 (PC4)